MRLSLTSPRQNTDKSRPKITRANGIPVRCCGLAGLDCCAASMSGLDCFWLCGLLCAGSLAVTVSLVLKWLEVSGRLGGGSCTGRRLSSSIDGMTRERWQPKSVFIKSKVSAAMISCSTIS